MLGTKLKNNYQADYDKKQDGKINKFNNLVGTI